MRTPAVLLMCAPALLACAGDPDEDAEPYVYADSLESTQPLASPRFAHAATLLDDGRVLVVGGIRGAPSQLGLDAFPAEVELFNPDTETFEQGAALASPRSWPSATRVADGRVVIVGGTTLDANALSIPALAIELWDPASESLSTIGQLPSGGVLFHCAAPIGDDLLVLDDCDSNACTLVRVDPDGGDAAITVLAGTPSYSYSLDVDCASLPDGRVMIAGGQETVDGLTQGVAYAEIYDPATESFELIGPISGPYGPDTQLAVLANGDVMLFGDGEGNAPLGQLYSTSAGEFSPIEGEVVARVDHSLTALDDGRVLIIGGKQPDLEFASGIDLFDPATGSFKSLTPEFAPRWGHTAVRLDSGPVLIVGGKTIDGHRADAYLYR